MENKIKFESPISSHLGKFINIKDSETNKTIEIQTPRLKVFKITEEVLILQTDVSFSNWLTDFKKICTQYFHKYLPRNKQSPSFEGESKFLTVKIKGNTEYFHNSEENEKIYIWNHSKIIEGDTVILLIETPGIWVNKNFYGTTWTAKQILAF